jgi:hypothetical protein
MTMSTKQGHRSEPIYLWWDRSRGFHIKDLSTAFSLEHVWQDRMGQDTWDTRLLDPGRTVFDSASTSLTYWTCFSQMSHNHFQSCWHFRSSIGKKLKLCTVVLSFFAACSERTGSFRGGSFNAADTFQRSQSSHSCQTVRASWFISH